MYGSEVRQFHTNELEWQRWRIVRSHKRFFDVGRKGEKRGHISGVTLDQSYHR